MLKYDKYYPDHQTAKVFNDMLGFRTLCDNYEDVLGISAYKSIRVADLSDGKAKDDGYRGVHVYFQLSSFHYPIEIHKYFYKKYLDNRIGYCLRRAYEDGKIKNENEFKEVLENVLSDCKKI